MRGLAPICHRIVSCGRRISAITAISDEGLVRVEFTYCTVNAEKFTDFLRGTLIPEMQPFDGLPKKSIIIMDNCSIHHAVQTQQLLNVAGILLFYIYHHIVQT